MSTANVHPITAASFEAIDREIGPHSWSPQEYAIVRRVIHSTADFEFNQKFHFSDGAIDAGLQAITNGTPFIVDVRMVEAGVRSSLARTHTTLHCAIAHAPDRAPTGSTRTATGMQTLALNNPQAVFIVGNAPTALLELVSLVKAQAIQPALIVGVPVGFISVEQSKAALAEIDVPQIVVLGRKGGSPVAAAIVNALVELAQIDQ